MLQKIGSFLRANKGSMLAAGGALAAGAGPAFAAVDTTAASGAFTDVGTAVNAVGPLMLTAVAAGIVYKWVTAFLI